MLLRIVRMEFQESEIEKFTALFLERKAKITGFPGCEEVLLKRDASEKNVFYTVSKWKDPASLENYRQSSFFEETWALTKKLFSGKPRAYSLVEVD